MNSDITPLFTTHYSIRDSLLTLDGDIFKKDDKGNKTKEIYIDDKRPVSLFALAAVHKLPEVFIVDSSLAGFWEAYKNSKDLNIPFYYGLKLVVCADLNVKDEPGETQSADSESSVVIFLKNSEAYKDAIKIYSKAATDGIYKDVPRLDWKTLNSMWTENLSLTLPFYSSFLARNLLMFRRSIIPDIAKMNPIFWLEDHKLPFDNMIAKSVKDYTAAHGYEMQRAHSIYYHLAEDYIVYQTLKCIDKRSMLVKPELQHFGSREFSFDSYQKLS